MLVAYHVAHSLLLSQRHDFNNMIGGIALAQKLTQLIVMTFQAKVVQSKGWLSALAIREKRDFLGCYSR